MYKDITFLENVKAATRQKVLNFVKTWNSKDEWLEVSTSGSTGKPKLIKLSKKQMKASAKATADFFKFNSKKAILLSLSTDYIAGKMMLIRAIENNMHIIVGSLSSNPLLSQIEHKIDFSAFGERNVDISLAGNTVTSGFSEKLAYISARYERNRILLNSDKIDLSLGGGLQAAYIHNSFMPQTSSDFPLSYSGLHTKLTVVPRLLVKFNNFALDFNMPFSVMQLNLNTFQEENPALSRAEQVSGRLEYLLFPSSYFLQARLGIVFDLN